VDEIVKALCATRLEADRVSLCLSVPPMLECRSQALKAFRVASNDKVEQEASEAASAAQSDTSGYLKLKSRRSEARQPLKKALNATIVKALKEKLPDAVFLSKLEADQEDGVVEVFVCWSHPEENAFTAKCVAAASASSLPSKKNVKYRSDLLWALEDGVLAPDLIPDICSLDGLARNIKVSRTAVWVAGRYLKLSRTLPQTPWVVDGETRLESSVEESIVDPLRTGGVNCGQVVFSSSGREDVDVRMLGNGRPFALEVRNLQRLSSLSKCNVLEKKINEDSAKKINVTGLAVVTKASVAKMNTVDGGGGKIKHYNALCVLRPEAREKGPLTDKDMVLLSEQPELKLQQKTPLRVLHRRTNMIRERSVFTMLASLVPPLQPELKEASAFRLQLRTQGGTYIKEFVHGELGRTTPSVTSILGRPVDIVALDCAGVEMDWPIFVPNVTR